MFVLSESGRLEASNVLGWISIACWIIVYSPQILENYRLKSGEGLSVAFVVIWLLGDIFNLLGGWMAGLLPTIIILAVYYTICDIILLCQIYYYRWTHPVHPASLILPRAPPNPIDPHSRPDEHSPLLRDQAPNASASAKTVEDEAHDTPARKIARYALLFAFVIGTGVAAWAINRVMHPKNGAEPIPPREDEVIEWKSQLMGYASAILYLGSRIPQILKNRETKCEGLSLALFMFTITGNLTYVLSICVVSMSPQHLLANASWLAGSGLTIFLDIFPTEPHIPQHITQWILGVRAVDKPLARTHPPLPIQDPFVESGPTMNPFSITVKQHVVAACECAWGAYVWSLQLIAYALIAYAVSKAISAYLQALPAAQPDSAAFIHARLSGRGVAQPVFRVPVFPLFHPYARPIVFGGPPAPGMIRRFLDRAGPLLIEATVLGLSTVTGLVRLMKRAHEVYAGAFNAVVTPLSTRLNRGIVQLSALPNVPIRRATLRYLRPLLLLIGVFIGILMFAGPSLKWAMALALCSLVLIVGGARGVDRQDIPAPGMANVGLIGALEPRAGARSAA